MPSHNRFTHLKTILYPRRGFNWEENYFTMDDFPATRVFPVHPAISRSPSLALMNATGAMAMACLIPIAPKCIYDLELHA